MSVSRLECLCDAIARLNVAHDPESLAYRLRNPLLIRSFAKPGKHETDEEGHRVFTSFVNGYKAGLFDLELKLSGKSRANVSADSPLEKLLVCYNINTKAAMDNIVSFIKRGLRDDTVTVHTPVSYFLEAK
jgi:hypothetical protein